MKRRDFITKSVLASYVLPSVVVSACETRVKSQPPIGNNGRLTDTFALNEMSVEDLQKTMEQGQYTARTIVEMYLKRIVDLDRGGIKLNSIIELNPDALMIAEERDDERKSGTVRGPLHGIPFLLKDNVDTGDKMMTTAGSLALSGHYAREDAPIVKQLRDAGAVLMGKTNLSEWANFRSSRSSSGWSSRGGQTKNPYSIDRN